MKSLRGSRANTNIMSFSVPWQKTKQKQNKKEEKKKEEKKRKETKNCIMLVSIQGRLLCWFPIEM